MGVLWGNYMSRWGSVLVLGICLLSACSKNSARDNSTTSFDVPVLDADRQSFLANFPLLDINGDMRPPVVGNSREWPLGALIYMPPSGRGGFCSVSHVSSGKVAANAHCVMEDGRAYNYFVVYYDRNGRKAFDRVKTIDYQGNSETDDVAILSLTETGESRWHVINAKIVPTNQDAGLLPPVNEAVTIWSFNPTPENHPDLYAKYKGPGMKFEPKSCSVSRTAPRVFGVQKDALGNVVSRINIRTRAQERLHLFVDACSKRMVKGNSGSLISEASNFQRVLGVYHWIVSVNERYSTVEYTGNNGQQLEFSPEHIDVSGIYGVGTAFEAAFANKPTLLNFFQNWTFDVNDARALAHR